MYLNVYNGDTGKRGIMEEQNTRTTEYLLITGNKNALNFADMAREFVSTRYY